MANESAKKMWDEFWNDFVREKKHPMWSEHLPDEKGNRVFSLASFEEVHGAYFRCVQIVDGKLTDWPYWFGNEVWEGGQTRGHDDRGNPVNVPLSRPIGQANKLSTQDDLMRFLESMRTTKVGDEIIKLFDVAITPNGFCIGKLPYPL